MKKTESPYMNYENILENIRIIAARNQPEQDISAILRNHSCDFLLKKIGKSDIRMEQLNKISVNERYIACKKIFEQIEINDFPYAVIKGAALSLAVYGNAYIRHSGDIDILIDRCNIDKINRIMSGNGFIQGHIINNSIVPFSREEKIFQLASSHQTAPYVKMTGNKLCPYIMVDINTDIMWGESQTKSDMKFVLEKTYASSINGVTFKKLCTEMEFISLCLHHYKDLNSIYLLYERGLKLNLFCDIYFFIRNCDIDKEKLYDYCIKLNVSEFIYYCLYYAYLIFQDKNLESYLSLFYSENAEKIINQFGLSPDERQNWDIDFYTRLFNTDLRDYLECTLSYEKINKIRINQKYM